MQDVLPARARRRGVRAGRGAAHSAIGSRRRPRDDVGRRALQHRHMRRRRGERGHERHRGRAAADDDDALAGDVEVFGPELRVDERPAEVGLAGELGAMAFVVAVVAAADVEEARSATARARRRRGARHARSSSASALDHSARRTTWRKRICRHDAVPRPRWRGCSAGSTARRRSPCASVQGRNE